MGMTSSESVQISRIFHAGYVFKHDNSMITFDPIFESPMSQNCYSMPFVEFDLLEIKKLKFDAVFITHYHDDHFSLESLQHLDRSTPIYMYCIFDEMFQLLKELGFKNVHSLKFGECIKINSFEVICHPALDIYVDSIFQVKVAGLNILNVVDSWIDDETFEVLEKQKSWDLVLWPFQLLREIETLSPKRAKPWDGEWPMEWKRQLEKLKPRILIPSSCQFIFESWSWLNTAFFPVSYQRFEQEMKILLPNTSVLRLDPSKSFQLGLESFQLMESLEWIKNKSAGTVDYKYDPLTKIPSSKEIAKKFPQLALDQLKQMIDFCESGLLEKFQTLEITTETYFTKTLFWKLICYDHQGNEIIFFYKIENSKITRVEENKIKTLGWLTEIPIFKFYRALFHGESLTSLYLRINDCVFDESIEKEIIDVDILNDPMLRCLYDGAIASYQKAQLKRIMYL